MGKLALTGGTPVRTKPFPGWPLPEEQDVEAVSEVIRSGRWCRIGPSRAGESKAEEFAKAFAAYQGAKYGLAVTSATAALEVSLRAAGIGPGDEVITTPCSFIATSTSILMVGSIPVFVDVDPRTYNIDPGKIEEAITERTRGVLPVHFGGLPCDMERIMAIAREHSLVVVEDASHSHGGKWKDKGLGTIGDLGAFSIGDGKNLTVGEGGVILTNDEELWRKAVYLHDLWCGGIGEPGRDVAEHGFPVLAWNYRFTEIQAVLGLSLLERLEKQQATRWENGQYLNQRLSEIDGVRPMRMDPYVTRATYHIYMFQYTGEGFNGMSRERFAEALQAEGIPARAGGGQFCLLYRHPLFTNPDFSLNRGYPLAARFSGREIDYRQVRCPEAERLCREEMMLIGHPTLLGTKEDMDDIIEAILKVKENADEAIWATWPSRF